jgi:hypothetical protein
VTYTLEVRGRRLRTPPLKNGTLRSGDRNVQ